MQLIQGDIFPAIDKISQTRKVVLPHVCNDEGAMGAGFVVPLCQKWPRVKQEYQKISSYLSLGQTQFVRVTPRVTVVNMVAQTLGKDPVPLKYTALIDCMTDVAEYVKTLGKNKVVVCAPKFGSVLAGGNFDFISELIREIWDEQKLDVRIYYL